MPERDGEVASALLAFFAGRSDSTGATNNLQEHDGLEDGARLNYRWLRCNACTAPGRMQLTADQYGHHACTNRRATALRSDKKRLGDGLTADP